MSDPTEEQLENRERLIKHSGERPGLDGLDDEDSSEFQVENIAEEGPTSE